MDYDLELINLIANHDMHETDNEDANGPDNDDDDDDDEDDDDENEEDEDEDEFATASIKQELREFGEESEYEEETINKKRKKIAKSLAKTNTNTNNSKKAKTTPKTAQKRNGRRRLDSDETSEELVGNRRLSLPTAPRNVAKARYIVMDTELKNKRIPALKKKRKMLSTKIIFLVTFHYFDGAASFKYASASSTQKSQGSTEMRSPEK